MKKLASLLLVALSLAHSDHLHAQLVPGAYSLQPGQYTLTVPASPVIVPPAILPSAVPPPITTFAGTPLDLTGYTQTFNDSFNSFDITNGGGTGPWYSPVFGNFGLAPFQAPGGRPNTYPWATGNQEIVLQKSNTGWIGGLFQSVNATGAGFSQSLGYFEATMQVDTQYGTWPAFWLLSTDNLTDPAGLHAEIDVLEFYGEGLPNLWYITGHVYNGTTGVDQNQPFTASASVNLGAAPHAYGALITNQWVIMYLDRVEVVRYPAWQESQKPMYMLLDHAMQVQPSDNNKRILKISSVKVYSHP